MLWRKRYFGTQSERRNRFAERLMTVAHTARKQRKDVLPLLTACSRGSSTPFRRGFEKLLLVRNIHERSHEPRPTYEVQGPDE